jgi:tetratricopeptide (TPR) repeat protein
MGRGDRGGIQDLERSIEIADSINSVESTRAFGNLASALADFGELRQAAEMGKEALLRAERFGLQDWILWLRGDSAVAPYYAGRWDESLSELDALIEEFALHRFWMETWCRMQRGRILLARGELAAAREDVERALELAREAKDPQVLWPALTLAAVAAQEPDRARALVDEFLSEWEAQGSGTWSESVWLPDLVMVAPVVGREERLLAGLAKVEQMSPWRRATAAALSGDGRAAAEIYRKMGAGPEEARARLQAAGQLVREGRRAEADAELERALTFWRSVGATAYVREGEALLAEAG